MTKGVCQLCLRTRKLRDSHYIPAAFYKLFRDGEPDSHPIVMTDKAQIMTAGQVRGHLLCDDCEGLFHRLGENWVLANFWRTNTEFRLRDALMATSPVIHFGEAACFDCVGVAGVDVEKLAYFAASVFWRGTLRWRAVAGQAPQVLDLGPSADELRRFLLGETDFPEGICLSAFVSASRIRMGEVSFPSGEPPMYWFGVPGLSFLMLAGPGVPPIARSGTFCTARSGRVLVAAEIDRQKLFESLQVASRGKPKGRLRKSRGTG